MPVGVGQPQVAAGELIEKIGHADFSFFRRRLYGAREARIGLPSRREAGIAAAHDQDDDERSVKLRHEVSVGCDSLAWLGSTGAA